MSDQVLGNLLRAFKNVIKDWGIFEVFFTVVFMPWSALYIAFRIIQEYEN